MQLQCKAISLTAVAKNPSLAEKAFSDWPAATVAIHGAVARLEASSAFISADSFSIMSGCIESALLGSIAVGLTAREQTAAYSRASSSVLQAVLSTSPLLSVAAPYCAFPSPTAHAVEGRQRSQSSFASRMAGFAQHADSDPAVMIRLPHVAVDLDLEGLSKMIHLVQALRSFGKPPVDFETQHHHERAKATDGPDARGLDASALSRSRSSPGPAFRAVCIEVASFTGQLYHAPGTLPSGLGENHKPSPRGIACWANAIQLNLKTVADQV